jgi:hypothetical protein
LREFQCFEIVEGLMEITALSLTDLLADEPAYERRPEKKAT